MPFLILNKILSRYLTKTNEKITIRYPEWDDFEKMEKFLLKIGSDFTFTTLNNTRTTRESQITYISNSLSAIEKQESLILFAIYENDIVGFCRFDVPNNIKKIAYHRMDMSLVIDKDFRGKQIGVELIKQGFKEIKTKFQKIKLITLSVSDRNLQAHKLYIKLGFEEVGRIQSGLIFDNIVTDELIMAKKIGEINISPINKLIKSGKT